MRAWSVYCNILQLRLCVEMTLNQGFTNLVVVYIALMFLVLNVSVLSDTFLSYWNAIQILHSELLFYRQICFAVHLWFCNLPILQQNNKLCLPILGLYLKSLTL